MRAIAGALFPGIQNICRLTPHDWLQTGRIRRAKDLLLSAKLDLADIALECGFADQGHFTRIFSRLNGAAPGAWRPAKKS